MAIGAIGNAIFVNQQTASVSSMQGNLQNRFDLQNVAAQAAVNEKEQEVQEVRPAEENHEVDEDREHQRQEADEETKRAKKEKNEHEEDEEEAKNAVYHLDIKV